jgi:hypothetical protein
VTKFKQGLTLRRRAHALDLQQASGSSALLKLTKQTGSDGFAGSMTLGVAGGQISSPASDSNR